MTAFTSVTCLLWMLAAQTPEASPPPPAEALEVRHAPLAQGVAGEPLVLKAQVAPAWRLGSLVARHRAAGEADFREVAFERSADGSYAAVIPVAAEQRRPVEYYLAAWDTDGVESVRFASAEAPHPVLVEVPSVVLEREALLETHGHRRSRVGVFAEYVNYGRGKVGDKRFPDRYYRLETDYLYRLVTHVGRLRLDFIRIGVGHLRARTPPEGVFGPGGTSAQRTGLDYGFSEVEASPSPAFGMAGRVLLGGNASGFAAGIGGRLRVGRPQGSRVELEGEYTSGLGGAATVRLGWDTVPTVPMSAAVQVTNVPSGPTGVRLLYRADYRLSESFLVGAQVGYQARSTVAGGPSLGLAASHGW